MPLNKQEVIRLNLGCGSNKIKGYLGLDVEKSCKPDIVHDFIAKPLPFKAGTVSEVVFFHTIEHLPKRSHLPILIEIFRVLKKGSKVYITYPDFWECAQRWKDNYRGKKEFWHATLFGRQLYLSDYHVCAMDPYELDCQLREIGFINVLTRREKNEPYNAITVATKGKVMQMQKYEEQLANEFNKTHLKGRSESGPNKKSSK